VRTARFTSAAAIAAVAAAAVAAGCGSSSKSSSSAGSTPAKSATTKAASTTAAPAALIATKHVKLGTVLAYGPKRLTVYLFEGDKGLTSSCAGACAQAWPPVTGTPKASGQALPADLGTIKRSDGTVQVTYKGHPLYRFVKDKDDGDTYGEGVKAFGAEWYVLAPSGNKIDES
jgi:predicted lipoprotein with Yx(FWY)xxD motif